MIYLSVYFVCIVALVTAQAPQDGYYCYTSGELQDVPCRFFAIVFDAGSTGTRLHLYRYVHNTNTNGIPFKVEQEIFQEVKPGLSSFNDDPSQAAKSIRPLLVAAQTAVPVFMWEKTPITLRATAGLRLLPGDIADEILDAVQTEILNSGFFAVPDAVSIMSGSDEGMYSWFTLNLLLNTLYSDNVAHPYSPEASRSVAAFDLGGGSTQLTFWPEDVHMFDGYKEYERDIDFFGNRIRLFTHSFLGNGLVAARLNMLLDPSQDEHLQTHLKSSCLPHDFELREWEYALKKWTIRGTQNYSFNSCYETARQFVNRSKIMKLPALHGKVVYLFSYYYDRGLNAGLVKENDGGVIKLLDYKVAAEKACARTAKQIQDPHWMAWQCHDLTYIYSLLSDGYGFGDTQPLFLAKKLKGMEVAWGQGLSYTLVHEFHKTQISMLIESANTTRFVVTLLAVSSSHPVEH
ncbi:GDA1/CD39 family protein [Ancylostoma duodenale]|uniref:GDA1/CD39 family protein n=1 Tax=Ancylostoma duodenale TaxID=51022 RepID=A0A0C2DUP7_9BILA|nr:GDA1/CD39 family protein [Ancylostoma duodenale]